MSLLHLNILIGNPFSRQVVAMLFSPACHSRENVAIESMKAGEIPVNVFMY
jgi:hypothetical protein